MKSKSCQSCGLQNPTWTERFTGTGLMTCQSCGSFSFFGDTKLVPQELYGKDYFEDGEYVNYEAHADVHRLNFRRKYDILKRYSSEAPRIFELGCAYGFFLEQAKQLGAPSVFGIDVSSDIVAQAQERVGKQHAGLASEHPALPADSNCIVAWDVWEHLESPFDLLKGYCAELEKGGLLALTTVDSGAAVARIRGLKWRQIHPPTHLHYPTRAGLSKALDTMGFDVVYHQSFGYYRALQTYAAALGIPLPHKSKIAQLPVYLNLHDIQFIIGKKR